MPSGSSSKNSTCCSVFVCFIWLSERSAISGFNNTDCLASITEMDSVHYAVRLPTVNKADTALLGPRFFSPRCFPLTEVVVVIMPSEAQVLWPVPVSRSLFRRCAGFLYHTYGLYFITACINLDMFVSKHIVSIYWYNFHIRTVHIDIIRVLFIHQLMH